MSRHLPLILLAIGISLISYAFIGNKKAPIDSNTYARARVYRLFSSAGMCSGVAVKADSGKTFILTAGHCAALSTDGTFRGEDEAGEQYDLKTVAQDSYADLLLLEGIDGNETAKVADELNEHEHMWSMTHGRNEPSHRSDGEALAEEIISAALFVVKTPADATRCTQYAKNAIQVVPTFLGDMSLCIMTEKTQASTVITQPGSSGGPVFNDKNELAGICSAGDPESNFSFWVPLIDIRRFLRKF